MARIIVNSFLREALGQTGSALTSDACLVLPAASMRDLLKVIEEKYPGSRHTLAHAAVAIDGDIYTSALAESLNDESELVFIPAIEGG